jgi:competence protein ComEC
MSTALKPVVTRFRAYQLGEPGSSFSYFADGHFTLIEAMVTELSRPRLLAELAQCGRRTIDTLHITSWDLDHCKPSSLEWILAHLTPTRVEQPGYAPHTECGHECRRTVEQYQQRCAARGHRVTVQSIDPPYIASLEHAQSLGYRDIFYHPRQLHDTPNDNSTIKFFRRGAFNVLSLGDVEAPEIASLLRRCKTLCREVDIMILAHHGADNGFTNRRLLEELRPSLAICTSDYDNRFEHPRDEIRALLHEQGIRLFTTKTGDAIVESIGSHAADYQVTNLIGNSTRVSSVMRYRARKFALLSMNADTVRNVLRPGFRGLR